MSVKNIIKEALEQRPLGVKEALEEILRERIAVAIEEKMNNPEGLDEARYYPETKVHVKSRDYSWGKMVTVHDGNRQSFPLHPEHQDAISKLNDGESTSFKDETGKRIKAKRDGDDIHLSDAKSTGTPVAVHRSKIISESIEDLDEARRMSPASMGRLIAKANQGNIRFHGPSGYWRIHDKDGKIVKTGERFYTRDAAKKWHDENMVKEEVELDEVSKATLGRYISKAASDLAIKALPDTHRAIVDPRGHHDRRMNAKRVLNRNSFIKKAADKILAKEDLGEAAEPGTVKDGYYVTNQSTDKISHDKPFVDSKSAIRHADKKEDETGKVHRVHHVKNGKIANQWEYDGGNFDASWKPFSDFKGEPAHQHLRGLPAHFLHGSE